ncbi:alpha/beta hydrolase [Candidatus Xianfuyuplasma coldseepsis]|uniref:Alpha/beta hydrolase n=1 Tax=Candidatus Xianfuyuplasma coldseepsis TaxID=2782163 RepID=A0A7L7KR49_9MOLU|nr:alpha/beta hydrolase [Xianfuyuplasma coldseepsis]QMS85055.1 alpha/beta hydrolase [Xianfuyuplasma coldseepsis]
MNIQTIQLHDDPDVTLTAYIQSPSKEMPGVQIKPAILICPGGGYHICSDREAEVIALSYLKEGYQAFVLRYSLMEKSQFPQPLHDAEMALTLIREHHEEWFLDPDKVAVIGFSAGAHLATMLATSGSVRPNALLVGYPTLMRKPRFGVEYPLPEVDDKTPEVFIFHTFDDDLVPVKNTLYLADQYNKHHIPFEVHVFRDGKHGLSLGNKLVLSNHPHAIDPHYQKWFDLSVEWLERVLQPFEK